ncbi:hypothetical protein [Pedosphaera parvula]|nr:hypothetical protein [Pedosphaera parvula]
MESPVPKPFIKVLLSLLVACALFSSCETATVVSTPIQPGMTKAELRSNFGPPIRKVVNDDGSEDWFYHFSCERTHTGSFVESSVTPGDPSLNYGTSSSWSMTFNEGVIRLSKDGVVTGQIPQGQIVRW